MISDDSMQRIRDLSIKDIVGKYVKLKKSGREWEANCPFHSEKTPSFKVNPAKNMYKCFGCGKGGDGISFVMEHDKLSYIDTIRFLAKEFNIELDEQEAKVVEKPVPRLEKLSKKSLDFLEGKRKISNNTLLRLQVTEAVEWMPGVNKEVPTICFNYYRDGELVNIKFRGPQKSFKLSKNAELIFYNLDAIKGEKKAIIVEGEIDTLTLHECGIYNVVGVPNGTPPPESDKFQLGYMDNCWHYFADKDEVIVAVDADRAGMRLREELARRIGFDKCKIVEFPKGCKDPNEILLNYGRDEVVRVFSNPLPWPIEGEYLPDEWEPVIDEYFEHGYPPGLRTHIPGFDQLLQFTYGQLTIVTGAPASGKSEFLDYVTTSLSLMEQVKWAVFSFETSVPVHASKLAEKFGHKAFDLRHNPDHRLSPTEYEFAKEKIKQYFFFAKVDIIELTIEKLLAKAEEFIKRRGCNGLIFDPWNCIEHKSGNMPETTYILMCLNRLIAFTRKYNLITFLVAHPKKLEKRKSDGKYPVPTLYDISGSAHFYNRTDNGFTVVRDHNTNQVDVYVQKVKQSWLGRTGFCGFTYNTKTRQYQFMPSHEPEEQATPAAGMHAITGGYKAVTEEIPFPDHKKNVENEEEEEPF